MIPTLFYKATLDLFIDVIQSHFSYLFHKLFYVSVSSQVLFLLAWDASLYSDIPMTNTYAFSRYMKVTFLKYLA